MASVVLVSARLSWYHGPAGTRRFVFFDRALKSKRSVSIRCQRLHSPSSAWLRRIGTGVLTAVLGAGAVDAIDPAKSLDQLVRKSWTTADGLPQNSVTDIVQTHDGYLWVATFGGMARFDGVRFTIFDVATSPGLRSNRITALHEDAAGVFWVGTEQGFVCRRQEDGFDCLGPEDGLPRGVVWSLQDDQDGNLWIATGGELGRLSDGRIRGFEEGGVLRGPFGGLALDCEGHLWVGVGGGLARWLGDGFAFEPIPLLSANLAPDDVIFEPRGAWLSVSNAVLRLQDGEARLASEAAESKSYGELLRDRDGNVWFAGDGVGRLRAGSLVDDGDRVMPNRTTVRSLFEDREGNLWIGTTGFGLHLLRDGIFSSYAVPSSSGSGGIVESAAGKILFGTQCLGLHLLAGEEVSRVEHPKGHLDCVAALLEDRQGRLWVGAAALGRRDGRRWTIFSAEDGAYAGGPVLALYEDRQATVWIGSRDGLASFDHGRFTVYSPRDAGTKDIRFITDDSRGNLWTAGPQGLTRFAGGEIAPHAARHFTIADGLPHNFVRALYEDGDGGLWAGTYGGGIAHLDLENDTVTVLSSDHGLPENAVSSILEDDAGNFWLSGNRGITRLQRAEAEAFVRGEIGRVHAVLYDEAEGIVPSETNGGFQPAAWKGSDGRIWYPTIRGITVVNPRKLRLGEPPPVAIERVHVGDRRLDPGQRAVIPPGDWRLEIEYTGLQLGLPGETQFRYRLVDHDEDWIEVLDRRTAYYTRIPPGTYRFEVTAAAYAGGAWNAEPATFDVVFEPFVYQTWWFRLATVLAAAGLLALIVRLRGMRRHAAELHSIITELEARNAEMERFTYTVSHDLKSPLVTIRGFLGLLKQDIEAGDRQRANEDMDRIRHASQHMADLLQDLLELSRVGRQINPPQQVSLSDLAHEAKELIAGPLAERQVEVTIAGDLPVVTGDRRRLLEVFQNLLENAVNFMGSTPEPRIEIGRREDGDETIVFVRDNGLGIAPEYHDKVFGLFDRLDAETEGTGIGLALVKRIVELHGGRIWVESPGRGHGSTFCFKLPRQPAAGK